MRAVSGFESKVLFAFASAVLVVTALTAAVWKMADGESELIRLLQRGHELVGNLARVRALTLQVELNTQTYRIAGDPTLLAERDAAIVLREQLLLRLQLLVANEAQQQQRLLRLREVIDERMAIARRVEQLRKTEGEVAAADYVKTAPLAATRQRVYALLRDLEADETRRLDQRSAQRLRAHRELLALGAAVTLLLLTLLAATYLLVRQQLRSTERGRQRLAESEERLSIILRSIGDAVLASDAEGRVTHMNAAAEALTGWPLAEARGHARDAVCCIEADVDGPCLRARDGAWRAVAQTLAPLRDAQGRQRGSVLVFRDVGAERELQQAIRAQNERLELRVQERTAQLRESEEHLRSVIANVPALIAYVDAQQRYVYVNKPYQDRFAPARGDLSGLSVREVLGEERYAIAAPLIERALGGEAQDYDWQPFPGVWQAISYRPRWGEDGRVSGYYVLGADITARKRTEAHIQGLNSELALRVNELEHVSRALRTLSAGNRTMLRARDEQGLLDSMCAAIVEAGAYAMAVVWYRVDDAQHTLEPRATSGYPKGLEGLRSLQASWADGERGRGAAARALRSGEPTLVHDMRGHPDYMAWQAELGGHASVLACPLRVDGVVIGALAIYHVEADAFDADEIRLLAESADDLAFGIATLRARVEQARIQAAMHQLTRYDALTGLPNEAVFSDLLVAAMHHSEQTRGSLAVLQTDIDRLREVNDALGFGHGDQMLREFGARLRQVAPAQATVARLRGDEFAVLLPDAGRAEVTRLALQLEEALAAPCLVAGIPLDLSAKTGIVLFPEHGATPHDLFRHMDVAVHEARRQGCRHVIFDPEQQLDRSGRLKLAIELRQAIESDELRLYLQPKVEMRSGHVCGAEALLRWQHPERGLVPPGEFIGLAEDTGLIRPLSEWVLRAVTGWLRAARGAAAGMPVAVNLSARNLRDEGLLEQLHGLRSGGDYPAGMLEIEITESSVMEEPERALGVLHGLREQDIALYVDDFGTGYSSLAYLQKLPVDFIKIDQSFVRSLGRDKDAAVIVRSTIDLVHDLGRQIVAEGIETREVWDLLAAWGCDIAQGYFIARPMPAADFSAWVAQFQPPQRR